MKDFSSLFSTGEADRPCFSVSFSSSNIFAATDNEVVSLSATAMQSAIGFNNLLKPSILLQNTSDCMWCLS